MYAIHNYSPGGPGNPASPFWPVKPMSPYSPRSPKFFMKCIILTMLNKFVAYFMNLIYTFSYQLLLVGLDLLCHPYHLCYLIELNWMIWYFVKSFNFNLSIYLLILQRIIYYTLMSDTHLGFNESIFCKFYCNLQIQKVFYQLFTFESSCEIRWRTISGFTFIAITTSVTFVSLFTTLTRYTRFTYWRAIIMILVLCWLLTTQLFLRMLLPFWLKPFGPCIPSKPLRPGEPSNPGAPGRPWSPFGPNSPKNGEIFSFKWFVVTFRLFVFKCTNHLQIKHFKLQLRIKNVSYIIFWENFCNIS